LDEVARRQTRFVALSPEGGETVRGNPMPNELTSASLL
jgi:hypothetical protein